MIRPYLKPIYTAARQMPGMEEYAAQMDSYEQVEAFDMADLDKAEKTSQPTGTGAQYRLAGIYDMRGLSRKTQTRLAIYAPKRTSARIWSDSAVLSPMNWAGSTKRIARVKPSMPRPI